MSLRLDIEQQFDTIPQPMLAVASSRATLALDPGHVVGLVGPPGWGMTRVGLSLLAVPARLGTVAAVDVRGWLSPPAAWEVGVSPEHLVVVRCRRRELWAQVVAALLEGLRAVYTEVPKGTADADLRRLAALARARRTGLVLRPLGESLPSGLVHWRLQAAGVSWEGMDRGHGRLRRRLLSALLNGKGIPEQGVEVEDDGTDVVRLVPRLVAAGGGAG